jgi:predicted aspartyl protease
VNHCQYWGLPVKRFFSVLLFSLCALTAPVSAIEQNVPLSQSSGGTLYLEATLESKFKTSFLLDTGSSLVTLNQATFDALTRDQKLTATRTSAARMANGKILTVSQYQLNSVRIGDTCEVGPVEVAVLPKGNNILGINTLLRVAPLTITPESVTLAGCQ